MFWSDMPVQAILDIMEYRKGEDKEKKREMLLQEARKSYNDDIVDKEIVNSALVRVFTRYFRIDGEVYFTLETETVEIFACPHPLSRRLGKEKAKQLVKKYFKEREEDGVRDENGDLVKDFDIDYEDIMVNSDPKDTLTDEKYKEIKEKFSLYPFAIFEPIRKNRSFFGKSDITTLIPTQCAINFMISMVMKCAENNAYNKIFAKPESLQGQEITNEPSQVIVDYSNFTNGWGIKFAESQPLPNGLLEYTDKLYAMTREVYGFNQVMDGSITNQDMSGYMLQQMIKQSNIPIEQQQKLFWQYNIEMAQIRLLFYKHYVDEAMYTYEYTESELEDEEAARQQLVRKMQRNGKLESMPNAKIEDFLQKTDKVQRKIIKGEDLYGVNFDISIDAMQGLSDSKLVEQQMWDNLLLNGGIQNISPDILAMYLQASPNVSPRTRNELKRIVDNLKHSQIEELKQQNAMLLEKLQQASELLKQMDAKNNLLNTQNKNLQKEFIGKINNANKIIDALNTDLTQRMQKEQKQQSSIPKEVMDEQVS